MNYTVICAQATAEQNGRNINENSDEYVKFQKDTKYMLNVISFIDDYIEYEASDYRNCITQNFKQFSVTYKILDVWNSFKYDEPVTPAPVLEVPETPGSHVIAYGLFGKFNEFKDFAARRHIIEKEIAQTLTQIVPEHVPTTPTEPIITRIVLQITLKLNFQSQTVTDLPKLDIEWADHIDPGIRDTFRVNQSGPVVNGDIVIEPYTNPNTGQVATITSMHYKFVEFLFKNDTINREPITKYILQLISNQKEAWKSVWLEIMKPSLFIDFQHCTICMFPIHFFYVFIIAAIL